MGADTPSPIHDPETMSNSTSSQLGDNEVTDVEKIPSQRSNASGTGAAVTKVATAQDWNGPDDPENPMNWPLWSKIYHTLTVGLLLFAATFGISVYTPGAESVMRRFHVSETAAFLPLSLYTLGLAFGPILGAPISETLGRRAVYLATFPPFFLFTMGAGLAQNFGTLLVCRFFAGAFCSPCLAVGAGSNSDLWEPLNRALSGSLFVMMPFFGPAIGPVVGGFAVESRGWRWTQWPILMVGGAFYLLSIPQKETYKKIILQKRAQRLNIPPPPQVIPPGFARIKMILLITVGRPIVMLFTEPIVGLFSIYTAFNFAVLYGFFEAFPLVFGGVYHFSLGQVGLSFLGIGAGCLFAVLIFWVLDRMTYRKWTLEKRARGDMTPLAPEYRLSASMVGSMLLPISLFWFAWSARKEVHWIVPILASVMFASGNLLVFCSTILYIIDTYGPLAGASGAAANGILRYIAGAAFPLFTVQMYRKMGIDWATSFFGFVTILLLPIPWLFFKFGPAIRAKSKYSITKA